MSGRLNGFTFATAAKIHFGCGASEKLNEEAAARGTRALVVCGSTPNRVVALTSSLSIAHHLFEITGEPTVEMVTAGSALALEKGCDVVIAIGGGSVIDAGKAISALMTNRKDIMRYLEVIGDGEPLTERTAPFIAVATTSGTGAEVTRNAVLASKTHGVKVSMRSESMLPDVAIVDPALTVSVPPSVTAATGLDTLTQVIEPYVSVKANPLTDAICEGAIVRVARSLRRAYDHGEDLAAREDMSFASLCGGLALANAGLGAVHGFAGPVGGMFPIPHGVVCGRLLPFVFKANVAAVTDMPSVAQKFAKVAVLLTGDPGSSVDDGVGWLDTLCAHLKVDGLSRYGVTRSDFDRIVEAAKRASSMKGNPVPLPDSALSDILEQAL
jgi:alcohol dehydrogenase class IV